MFCFLFFLCPSNFFGLSGGGYKYEKERGNKREKTLGGGRKNKGSSLPLPCGWICLVCQWRVIFSCISYFNRLLSGVKITNENEAFKVSLYFVCTLIQLLRWSCAAAIVCSNGRFHTRDGLSVFIIRQNWRINTPMKSDGLFVHKTAPFSH